MPFPIWPKGAARTLGATLGLTALIAAPAHAAAGPANPGNCSPVGKMSQPFTAWNDFGLYTPIRNAGVEAGTTGWTLSGGATVVAGNEPWFIGGATDGYSLDLPKGASAVSSTICIDETYTHFRAFARNADAANGDLRIEVLYYDTKGKLISTKPFAHRGASSAWQLTNAIPIVVFNKKATVASAPVAFRFTAKGNSHYQVDDVYVDPWSRS